MQARSEFLQELHAKNRLAPNTPVEEGIISAENKGALFGGAPDADKMKKKNFYELVNGQPVMNFFDRLLGGKSMTYDYK